MKKTIVTTILFLFLMATTAVANSVCDKNYDTAKNDLKESLSSRYGSSYSTIKLLLDSGMDDYKKICSLPNDPVKQGIVENLAKTYYPNFSTIWLLYEANYKDYKALQ